MSRARKKTVVYVGNPSRVDEHGEYDGPRRVVVHDRGRKNDYVCRYNEPTEVPAEVAKRLEKNPFFLVDPDEVAKDGDVSEGDGDMNFLSDDVGEAAS